MTVEPAGYWILADDRTVRAFGNAPEPPEDPPPGTGYANAVGMAALGEGRGACILDAGGGLRTFGEYAELDPFERPDVPAVGIAGSDRGEGVWIAFADGTVIARGSADPLPLTAPEPPTPPVVAITATSDGTGYWLLDGRGRVASYGSAPWWGDSEDTRQHPATAVGLAPTPDARGYWIVRQDGAVFCCGDAPFLGSPAGVVPVEAVTIAASSDGTGYWILGRRGEVLPFGMACFVGDRDDGSRAVAMLSFEAPDRAGAGPAVGEAIRVALTGGRESTRPYLDALELPRSEQPVASIVIPVHNESELTARCLASIEANSGDVEYEVIVVDDASVDETATMLESVPGVRVVTNEENAGYLRSTNAGAAEARAPYLVLLNNDTEVRPGWLRALLDTAAQDPMVGIVGAKLLYPDGLISEAGGIVWRDGHAYNVGRYARATRPEYSWVRDVDYVSAACLLVRRDLWQAVGGFDERYDPAYYEDVDLAFATRQRGLRVVFQPSAEVVHLEGASHGTDQGAGIKRFQTINRDKFVAKWAAELRAQHPNNTELVITALHRRRHPEVLFVEATQLTPDRDAGSGRTLGVLDALVEMGCTVSFAVESADEEGGDSNEWTKVLQRRGVEVIFGPRNLQRFLMALGAELDLCILSRPEIAGRYLPLVRSKAPRALVAFDTVDLHFVRESRRAGVLEGDGAALAAAAYLEVERALARASDVTIVATEADAAKIREVAGDVETLVIPTVHASAPNGPPFEHRSGLLFVGNFLHTPNVDAVAWFVEEVLPRVRERTSGVLFHVVGPEPPPGIIDLAGDDVDVLGWVRDLDPVYAAARVVVAPLRYGAGMKGKIGEALSHGVPVVTTSIGNEGTGLEPGRELLVADDAAAFAEAVVDAHTDPGVWRALATAGRAAAERLYSPSVTRTRVEHLLRRSLGEAGDTRSQGGARDVGAEGVG